MKACRKLEKYLEKGRFGDRLTDVPDAIRDHVSECEACRMRLDSFERIEKAVWARTPEALPAPARARIRSGVAARTAAAERRHTSRIRAVRRGTVLAAKVLLAVLAVSLPRRPSPLPADSRIPEALVAQIDSDTREQILDGLAIGIYDPDFIPATSDGLDALILETDNTDMIEAARDILPPGSYSIYDEELLNDLSELEDSDWAALRRYLS